MRRPVMTIMTAALVATLCAAAPASASTASTTWRVQPTPSPPGGSSMLNGVSCPSATACTAVGDQTRKSGTGYTEVTLAERRNGGTWTLQAIPDRAGAVHSELDGVWCVSPADCTAFGWDTTRSGAGATLAEHWDGTRWAIQATPDPAGSTQAAFYDGACVSSTDCTAVGFSTTASGSPEMTLAEHWDGSNWAVQAAADPAGSTSAWLDGVSCPSAARCTAVGGYFTAKGQGHPLAERWDGSGWFIQAMPSPVHAGDSYAALDSVSCPSATRCTAVGGYVGPHEQQGPLAEAWDGASWVIQSLPAGFGVYGDGVSCPSANNCTAVGYGGAAHWDGTRWELQATPNPHGNTDWHLNGVSCRSAACTAVGQAGKRTLAERHYQQPLSAARGQRRPGRQKKPGRRQIKGDPQAPVRLRGHAEPGRRDWRGWQLAGGGLVRLAR